MEPGMPVMMKVPTSKTKKHELLSVFGVYMAARVTPSMTCVIYDINNDKLDEVAINDLVPVTLTDETKSKVKIISERESAAGRGLKLGDVYATKALGQSSSSSKVLGEEGGGGVTAAAANIETTTPSLDLESDREKISANATGDDPPFSFVTNVEKGSGISSRTESIMSATRHPPQRMHVNRDEQSKLLRILIKMHAALRKKKSQVEHVYSL